MSEKVVSFLTEKEERRAAAGHFYEDKKAAKKRERKARYRARKEEEEAERIQERAAAGDAEAAEKAVANVLRDVVAEGQEGSVPAEFRGEFESLMDHFAEEVDVPDMDSAFVKAKGRRERKAKREEMLMEEEEEDSEEVGADDEEDEGDFDAAMKDILDAKPGRKGLAGDDVTRKKIRAERAEQRKLAEEKVLKQMVLNKSHQKIDITKNGEERKLRMVATRGVVQLFNAIAQHQSALKAKEKEKQGRGEDEHSDSSDDEYSVLARKKPRTAKKEDSSAQEFLALLKNTGKTTAAQQYLGKAAGTQARGAGAFERKAPKGDTGKWDALKDDFMLTAKATDWKKGADNAPDARMDSSDSSDSD